MHAKRLWASFLIIAAVMAAGRVAADAATLSPARYGATSTLLPDGNILIVGGQTDDTPTLVASGAGAVQLSLESRHTIVNASETNFIARTSHTATLLPNGQVLIAGGNGALQSIQVYDPVSNCWTPQVAVALSVARFNHTATLLKNGKVLLCGGQSAAATFNDTCDLYTPPTTPMSCASAPSGSYPLTAALTLLASRALHTATLLGDGRVFITGGRNAGDYLVTSERVDPNGCGTDCITRGAAHALIEARANHRATLLGNGKVFIAGGFNGRNPSGSRGFLDTVEIYDPAADSVVPAAAMKVSNSEQAQSVRNDGMIETYGGLGNITTNYIRSISIAVDPTSHLDGCFSNSGSFCDRVLPAAQSLLTKASLRADTWTDSPATHAPLSLLRLPFSGTLSPAVSGVIQDGAVLFSSPTLVLPDGGKAEFIPGADDATSGPSGTYINLKGTSVTCSLATCGLFSGTYNLNLAGMEVIGTHPATLPTTVMSAPSAITINTSGCVGGSTCVSTDPPPPITGGELKGTLTITGLPKQYIGATVSSGVIDGLALAISSEAVTYNLTGGQSIIDPLTVTPCTDGSHFCATDLTNVASQITFTVDFKALTGTASPKTPTDPVPASVSLVGKTLAGTTRMRMVVTPISLTGGETFQADVATIVIHRMIFSDVSSYNPTTNSWEFGSQDGTRMFGQTATLTPTGTMRMFGGRACDSAGAFTNKTEAALLQVLIGPWAAGATMQSARGNHTTTLLPSGKMLVAGGSDGTNVLSTSDLFDPVMQTFSPTNGEMTVARDLHTATLLLNGRVLVAGGFSVTGATTSAEIYYPESNAWRPTSSMLVPASNHTATLLPDGNVLVAGGYRDGVYLQNAAIYYSTAAAWFPIDDMPTTRALHTATMLQDGRVLFTGGVNEGGVLNTALIFDPNYALRWYTAANLPLPLHSQAAAPLKDGRVLIVGGNDGGGETEVSLVYTPTACPSPPCAASGSWTDTRTTGNGPNLKRFSHTATLLPDGIIALIGGAKKNGESVSAMERFDVSFSSFQVGPALATKRAFHTATLAPDGQIYVIGGFNGTNMLATSEQLHFTGVTDSVTPGVAPKVRQSSITAVDVSPFGRGVSVTLTGTKFLGTGEAAGGGAASGNSSHHNPRMIMQAVDGSGGTGSQGGGGGFALDLSTRIYRATDPNLWSKVDAGSLTVTMPSNLPTAPTLGGSFLPYGWYQLRTYSNSVYSDSILVQAGPPKPTGTPGPIGGTVLGISSISWTWSAGTVAGADGYAIYSSSSGIFIATSAATTFLQSGLEPNTAAAIKVAGFSLSGDGPLRTSATNYTQTNPVTNLGISSVSYNSVRLDWNPNRNTLGTIYEISLSTDNFLLYYSTPVPTVSALTSTSAVINALSQNTVYYFRVRAFDGAGFASDFTYSVPASTRTRAPIDGLNGTPVDTTSIQWNWRDPVPGDIIHYNVYNSTSGELLAQPEPPNNFYFDVGLATNSQRSVIVSAVSIGGEGPLSASASAYTLAAIPGPNNPPLVNITTGSFTASWAPNGNPLGTTYELAILDSGDHTLYSAKSSGFNGGLGGLQSAYMFTAKVRAFNRDNIPTDYITLGTETTLAQAPKELVVTGATGSSIFLQWNQSNNSSSTTYEVTFTSNEVTSNQFQTALPFSQNFNGNTAEVSGLLTSSTYSFRVQGKTVAPFNVVTGYTNFVTTRPFNGGVAFGSLGLAVDHLHNSTTQGSVGQSPGRFVSLLVPSDTFPSDTFMTISTFSATGPSPCAGGIDIGLSLTPNPALQPMHTIFFRFSYTDAELGGQSAEQLTLMRLDPGSGRCVPVKTTVDTNGHTIMSEINHLSQFQIVPVAASLTANQTVVFPNPFYPSQGNGYVTFSQMPNGSRVRIFTMRGEVVADMTANASGIATWGGTNKQSRSVASGVYFAVVEGNGTKKVLKVVVLR